MVLKILINIINKFKKESISMVKLEKTLLDKFVHGAFLNKRKIGRPLKYNIRTAKETG